MAIAARVWPDGEFWVGHVPKGGSEMGLVNLRNSHNRPRGRNGITSNGKRLIRQGCHILFEKIAPECVSFLTLSVPGSTMADCRSLSWQWSEVVRKTVQELRRELRRSGLSGEIVGCVEIQPKRFERTGQPWPHLHLVFQGKKVRSEPWAVGLEKTKRIWVSGLSSYADLTEKQVSPGVTFKTCFCNPSRYLSKYMSKGKEVVEQVCEQLPNWRFPASWYVCSNVTRTKVKKGMVHLVGKPAAALLRMAQMALEPIDVWVAIEAKGESDGRSLPLGFCGRVPVDWWQRWRKEADRKNELRSKMQYSCTNNAVVRVSDVQLSMGI